jgi:eukaryotic-like serine/threonine-protein kinase
MTPEQWDRIDRVWHAVLNRPPEERTEALAELCAGDSALLRDVTSLLAHRDEASAVGFGKNDRRAPTPSIAAGTRLGPYVIEALIGSGGMGDVYRARDHRLGRQVAIKVLPAELGNDADRLRRFKAEAQATAALNHPNILAIHDIGTQRLEGVATVAISFLVTELLEGRTLRQLLVDERLSISRVIDFASQIAQGLAAAHARGIVHRDLKPENLFVTSNGPVKILDFGLAKALAPVQDSSTATRSGTAVQMVLGTPGYMSPEQVRGQPVDHRSDVFAFGAVLFEMLTGQRAFSGDTPLDTMSAVLREPPCGVLYTPTRPIPPSLVRIVERCLEKSPADRFQSTNDLAFALKGLTPFESGEIRTPDHEAARDSDSHRRTATTTPKAAASSRADARRNAGWLRWSARIAAAIVIAAAATWVTHRYFSASTSVPRLTNALKITGTIGEESSPAWSPDGRALAYQSNQAGKWDVWVAQVGGGDPINRTAGNRADSRVPRWSPDGQWIAFASPGEDGGVFVMAGVGGTPRKVASWPPGAGLSRAEWSPDSTQLAYAVSQQQDVRLEILSLDSRASHRLQLPRLPRNNYVGRPSWSHDQRWLAYSRAYSAVAANSELWATNVSDGRSVRLTDDRQRDSNPSWSPDSRELFFVSNRGGPPDLWRLLIGSDATVVGAPQQVTVGLEVVDATLSADGKKVAYSKGRSVANVFRVPISSDRTVTWSDARQLTFDEAEVESIDVSRDGRLVFSSDRSGNWDIWMMPAGGGDLQQLTRNPAIDAGPRWRVDAKEVVFYSSRSGHREIWVLPMSGGPARQITSGDVEMLYPSWSPDGQEIVTQTSAPTAIVAVRGGGGRRLTDEEMGTPEWSPDGKSVAFTFLRDTGAYIGRAPASGGPVERLTKNAAHSGRWSPDGTQIYFIGAGSQPAKIWRYSVGSRDERLAADLSDRRGGLGWVSLATDGRYLYFSWGEMQADIWVADIVRK